MIFFPQRRFHNPFCKNPTSVVSSRGICESNNLARWWSLHALTCLYWRILCPNTRFTLLLFSTLKLSKALSQHIFSYSYFAKISRLKIQYKLRLLLSVNLGRVDFCSYVDYFLIFVEISSYYGKGWKIQSVQTSVEYFKLKIMTKHNNSSPESLSFLGRCFHTSNSSHMMKSC